MAKDKLIPCIYYESRGNCLKGREAEMTGYCQHCNLYKPRASVKILNEKKEKIRKLREKETY